MGGAVFLILTMCYKSADGPSHAWYLWDTIGFLESIGSLRRARKDLLALGDPLPLPKGHESVAASCPHAQPRTLSRQ